MLRRVWVVAVVFGILAAGVAATRIDAVACTLIEFSDLELITPGVYVDRETTFEQRRALLATYDEAKQRVAKTFGALTATPVIIAGRSMVAIERFSDNEYARTVFTPMNCFIVLGPKGHDIDIIAHELVHAELFHRVGYWNRTLEIPVWFDEGAAMQVDYRERYDVRRYRGNQVLDKSALQFSRQFFSGDDEQLTAHYSLAKEEVRRWLEAAGPGAFYELLRDIKAGHGFESAYTSTTYEDRNRN